MVRFIALCTALLVFTFAQAQQPKQEMRAVWIATVNNIDYPLKPTTNSETLQQEFIRLLDMHQRNGMNAIVMQVRPATDAFYPSPLEPWSQWLTGTQGQPPVPYFDPLAFMITGTHKRKMEFHAWMNPYRAVFNTKSSSVAPTHVTRLHPEWFVTYGDTKYFDPGNKEVQKFVTMVVQDVVHRYEVDAIHFDDYFYPYPLAGKEFPDQASYAKYGNGLSRADWRRSNTDSIILSLSKAIKKENSKCQFGISPFGIWRNVNKDPRGSNTVGALSNYDDLYADILLWLQKGWIDYVTPQLYWEIGHKTADFNLLIDWWSKNTFGKNCYIGLGIYRAGSNAAWRDKTQIPRQITKIRNTPNINGMIFFSSKTFEKNPYGWNDTLRNNFFSEPALPPTPTF